MPESFFLFYIDHSLPFTLREDTFILHIGGTRWAQNFEIPDTEIRCHVKKKERRETCERLPRTMIPKQYSHLSSQIPEILDPIHQAENLRNNLWKTDPQLEDPLIAIEWRLRIDKPYLWAYKLSINFLVHHY